MWPFNQTRASAAVVFIAAAVTASLVLAIGASPALASWYSNSWAYRKAITIDHTKVTASQTSFPVLINLASDSDLAAHALSSGYDILFTSSDAVTKINYERESYTSGTGALIAWVQVPSLSSASNTVIYMYFGNASASDQQNATGTWDSNYSAVWHLPNGTTLSTSDSTSNANNATNSSATATTGKMDGGASFNGFFRYITAPSATLPASSDYTVSLWFKTTSNGPLFDTQTTAPPTIPSWGWDPMLYVDSTGKLHGGLYTGTYPTLVSSNAVDDGNWHYATLVVNMSGTTQTLYLDGQSVGTFSGTPEGPFSTVLIGAGYASNWPNAGAPYFNGQIDEVRTSKSATDRSSTWIGTEYNNQNSPSTFYSVGSLVQKCGIGGLGILANSSLTFPGVTLTGWNQTSTTTFVVTPDDETLSGSGWHVTGTSTTFTNGTQNLSTTAATLTGVSAAAATPNCSLPTNSVGYPVTLPAGASPPTAVSLSNAAAGTGSGATNLTMTYQVAVPANTYSGTYSSTWTLSIVSGP